MNQLIHSLEAHYYTDENIFKAECKGLLSRTWQVAGHRSQLQKPGEYFTFEIADESLFCIMGRDHQIRCFYNVCQHRAHRLVSGEGSARVLVCPYHAWTYELTGELRGGPNLTAVEGLDKSAVCLTEVKTELFLGFIFINLDLQAKPMDEWYPGVRNEIEEWLPHWSNLNPVEWVEVKENCNWKVSVENYSECYHCAKNHPAFANGIIKPETYDIQPQGYCLRHTTECQSLGNMSYDIDKSRPHAEEYSSWFLWPMFSFQVYPGNVLNTYHWRAIDTEQVVVWRGWYTLENGDKDMIHRLAQQDFNTTVKEDIMLVESVQQGLKSRGYVPGPLVIDPKGGVNSEHSLMALQRWMREALED